MYIYRLTQREMKGSHVYRHILSETIHHLKKVLSYLGHSSLLSVSGFLATLSDFRWAISRHFYEGHLGSLSIGCRALSLIMASETTFTIYRLAHSTYGWRQVECIVQVKESSLLQ